ncbi:MAG: putative S-adenosylmethionine:tRNA ribosyltransferase-isomerase [Geminicoccaceae bacterium]|nr:putative S-adenosylmethionine:tRNA ribosyltransferase-isomerase [Geminicoccaceae bacterium]
MPPAALLTGKATPRALDFEVPENLLAREPPEARGLARDQVRLLVTGPTVTDVRHASMRELPAFLRAGDLVVVNSSATINAALAGCRIDGTPAPEPIAVHLSSPAPHVDDPAQWMIELRRPTVEGTRPLLDARPGERIRLRGGGSATLIAPLAWRGRRISLPNGGVRLWTARLECPGGVREYAAEHGAPIRYGYVSQRWPLSYYQTVFADEPGSAEMPSAGRPFTTELVARLHAKGVSVVSLVLHTGVASLETGEAPYPERYRVSDDVATAVNRTRDRGGRVIAVGTTVVRALETVASPDGAVHAGAGWTDLVVTPREGIRVVDGLLTGFHEPRASHLAMLEAIAGRELLAMGYDVALREGYLWHEFGDVHLIVGSR